MWVDADVELFVCPVLSFTPEVQEALHWFALTHQQVVAGLGSVHWMRTALPAAGGVGDQDARLFETLEFLRTLHDQLTQEAMQRHQSKTAIDRWRRTRRRRT